MRERIVERNLPSTKGNSRGMLEGSVNFRDMGGLRTADGRSLRSGVLYRSGSLHALTAAGRESLAALGVRAVFDLRSDEERTSRPPNLPPDGSIVHRFHHHARRTGDLFRTLHDAARQPNAARDLMIRVYRRIPFDFAESYERLFGLIASTNRPIVFNCAAGKDRTGIAAALLMSAIGVLPDEISGDYRATDAAFARIVEMFVTSPSGHLVADLPEHVWHPILRTDLAYLDAAFQEIDARCGSLKGYFREVLHLSPEMQAALHARLII